MYKCLLHVKNSEQSMVKLSNFHGYSTRNSATLCIPDTTSKFEKSPVYQGIILYNHVPSIGWEGIQKIGQMWNNF